MKPPPRPFRIGLTVASIAIAMLGGCRTMIRETDNGRWIEVPRGSTLTLTGAVTIAEDRARVFFVNGRARNTGASYQPSCALEVRRISRDGPQTIPPGVLRIDRVQHYWTEVVDNRRSPVPGADPVFAPVAAPTPRLADYGGDGGDAMIQTGYHLWLDEGTDPNLMRLTCLGVLADPAQAFPPTLDEIRTALGRLATLEVAATPR